ncbi:hypothetical protein LR48_Vigan08g155900 [Vigna angularis]|uniref:Uncharacterized protein n=1 Tax=Phaseolus angularis TaxID=3914 RepID=A0A0L9V723_PHAAN|nr:hypothetical protein LR48_Vigan08g155900 [Vigna angularis]
MLEVYNSLQATFNLLNKQELYFAMNLEQDGKVSYANGIVLNKLLPTVTEPILVVCLFQPYTPYTTIRNRECNNWRKFTPPYFGSEQDKISSDPKFGEDKDEQQTRNVANNNLEGTIPRNISSCKNLNLLNVHGNKLNETIPPALQSLEHDLFGAVTLFKAAILGITLGALVILLMVFLAACRPHSPPFHDGSLDKPASAPQRLILLLELLTGRKAVDNESNLHHLGFEKNSS